MTFLLSNLHDIFDIEKMAKTPRVFPLVSSSYEFHVAEKTHIFVHEKKRQMRYVIGIFYLKIESCETLD